MGIEPSPSDLGWKATTNTFGTPVVYPLNDLREHHLDGPCWCRPFDDDGVTVHNSMDGRETHERGRPKQ